MRDTIYLDYNSTTPVRPEVIKRVTEVMSTPGNASSVHTAGRNARKHVERARAQIAALTGCKDTQVTFNGGATEGNNTVLKAFKGHRVLVSAIEHPSVLDANGDVESLPVTASGTLELNALEDALRRAPAPRLVSVMLVNNETGVIQPLAEIAALVKARDALLHVDAAQAAGRIPVEVNNTGIDFLTLSAHKFGGPQGVGALISGRCTQAPVLLKGGGQERRSRAGTENVAGIAGFGLAAEMALHELPDYQRLGALRDAMEERLAHMIPELVIFGTNAPRVANTSLMALPGVPSKTQLINLDLENIAVSSGSACSSGKVSASHVLRAMGASDKVAGSALRVSMGWGTGQEDVESFINAWIKLYERVKNKVGAA